MGIIVHLYWIKVMFRWISMMKMISKEWHTDRTSWMDIIPRHHPIRSRMKRIRFKRRRTCSIKGNILLLVSSDTIVHLSFNRSRNPILNKSFDVLPQIKDDDTPYADPITENNVGVRLGRWYEELSAASRTRTTTSSILPWNYRVITKNSKTN